MLKLRPYQEEAIELILKGFVNNQRQIYVLPTGGGKTVIFSEIAVRAGKKNKTVLVLTDRKELFKQAANSIERLGIPICKINAESKTIFPQAKMFVGMIETVARRLNSLKGIKFDLIIIDECHKGNFFKAIDTFPEDFVLGMTATPINKNLHKYYTNLVTNIDIQELIDQGFLCHCRAYQMQDDLQDLEVEKAGNEFTEKSLFKHYNNSKLYEGVVEEYLDRCKGMKTIVFNVNIEHAETMTRAFKAAGIQSYCITSKTSDADREFILDQFSKGAFQVLNNCGILTTGYDEPTIEAVIVNRATMSLALWLQMVGRGSRPCEAIRKTEFVLLDFGKNHDRHGLWNERRKWDIKPKKRRASGIGAAPIKVCKGCEAMIAAVAKKCNFCGYEYPLAESELKKGVMTEVVAFARIPEALVDRNMSSLSVSELFELMQTKQYTAQLIWRIVRSKGKDSIEEFAKVAGYGRGWVVRQVESIEKAEEEGRSLAYNDYKIKQVIK